MLCSLFDIYGLAVGIFQYVIPEQIYHWIHEAFETLEIQLAQHLIRWSQLLTLEMYKICKDNKQMEFFFTCHLHAKVGNWIKDHKKIQFAMLLDPSFNRFFDVYSIRDSPGDILKCGLDKQSINALAFGLFVIKACFGNNDIAIKMLCQFISSSKSSAVVWTSDVVVFLTRLSSDITDAFRTRFSLKTFSIKNSTCLDALYQNHILDQSQICQYFLKATDTDTIVAMFQPHFPIHPKHSNVLLQRICKYHKPQQDIFCRLFQRLWVARDNYKVQNMTRELFNYFDSTGPHFKSLFPTNRRFFKQAIRRKCKQAIRWGIENLPVTTKVAKTCLDFLIARMPHARQTLAKCIAAWPNAARKIKHKLNDILFTSFSLKIGDALANAGLVEWETVTRWTKQDWSKFARAPQEFVTAMWQNTPIFNQHLAFVFLESLRANNQTAEFLWLKNQNVVQEQCLIRNTLELFTNCCFSILQTIASQICKKRIATCYEFAAEKGSKEHFVFLHQYWHIDNLKETWIQTAIENNIDFLVFFYKENQRVKNKITRELLINSKKTKIRAFLQGVNFNCDDGALLNCL